MAFYWMQQSGMFFLRHAVVDFLSRDRIHFNAVVWKELLMTIRACSECSDKIPFKGLRPWIHPVFWSNSFFSSNRPHGRIIHLIQRLSGKLVSGSHDGKHDHRVQPADQSFFLSISLFRGLQVIFLSLLSTSIQTESSQSCLNPVQFFHRH